MFILHPFVARRSKGNNKRALQVTGSGKSLHDPVSVYEDKSMASLKEKLARAEEVCIVCVYCVGAYNYIYTYTHVLLFLLCLAYHQLNNFIFQPLRPLLWILNLLLAITYNATKTWESFTQ